jgi:hypothetical protein
MKKYICLLVITVCGALMAAQKPLVKASFVGGTIAGLEPHSDARIDLTQSDVLVIQFHSTTLQVPYRKISVLEYGQNVNRRYIAAVLVSPVFVLSKSRKHYVTIGYLDEQGSQQALVLQVGKHEIRSVLAGLEARSGRRVEFTDNEARKSGRG